MDNFPDVITDGMDEESFTQTLPAATVTWPSKEHMQAIQYNRPPYRLKPGHENTSEPAPLLADHIARRKDYLDHACTQEFAQRVVNNTKSITGSARANIDSENNWADAYHAELDRAATVLAQNPSRIMAFTFLTNHLHSRASQDAFLRLLAARDFSPREVGCATFHDMQTTIMNSMPGQK